MRKLSILLIFFCAFGLSAQQTTFFNKDQINWSWKKSVFHYQELGNGYSGVYKKWQTASQGNGAVLYNEYGDKTKEYSLPIPYRYASVEDAAFIGVNNNLYLCGSGEKDWGGWGYYSFVFDENSQVVWSLRDTVYICKLKVINDSIGVGVLFVAKTYKSLQPSTYLAWINLKSGNVIKTIKDSVLLQEHTKINTANFYLREVEYNNGVITINGNRKSTGQYFIKLLNDTGAFISQSEVKIDSASVFYTAKNTYFTSKATWDRFGKYQTIERYGHNHKLQFSYSIDTSYYSDINGIVVNQNNETVIMHTPYDSTYNRNYSELIWLTKAGKLKRKCNYKFVEGSYVMNSLISTKDNGLFMKVFLHSVGSFGSAMLKTDSVGMVNATGVTSTCKDFTLGIQEIKPLNQPNQPNQPNQLKVYPNPTTNQVNIASELLIKTLTLYSITGEEKLKLSPNKKQINLSLAEFASGVYYVVAETEWGAERVKVVKW